VTLLSYMLLRIFPSALPLLVHVVIHVFGVCVVFVSVVVDDIIDIVLVSYCCHLCCCCCC